jgi:hypothetical protein
MMLVGLQSHSDLTLKSQMSFLAENLNPGHPVHNRFILLPDISDNIWSWGGGGILLCPHYAGVGKSEGKVDI